MTCLVSGLPPSPSLSLRVSLSVSVSPLLSLALSLSGCLALSLSHSLSRSLSHTESIAVPEGYPNTKGPCRILHLRSLPEPQNRTPPFTFAARDLCMTSRKMSPKPQHYQQLPRDGFEGPTTPGSRGRFLFLLLFFVGGGGWLHYTIVRIRNSPEWYCLLAVGQSC